MLEARAVQAKFVLPEGAEPPAYLQSGYAELPLRPLRLQQVLSLFAESHAFGVVSFPDSGTTT